MSEERPNEELRAELEDALGREVDPDAAERALSAPRNRTYAQLWSDNHLLIGLTLVVAVVFGVVLSVFLKTWVFLPIALLAHATGTLVTSTFAMRLASTTDKPDPVTVARLEDEGVVDPELKLDQAARELGEVGEGNRLR